MNINICVADNKWKGRVINKSNSIKILKTVYQFTNNKNLKKEINILYSDNNTIQEYNLKYRNKNTPTNVLSFVSELNDFTLGDIIFAFEYIEKESLEQGKLFQDHLTHLLVHSFLHLIGFDHIEEKERNEMEKLEIEILKSLFIANPYEL